MRSVMIAAMLATIGSLAFVEHDADVVVVASEHDVVSYAGLDVPVHLVPVYLEPVFSWPPGSFYDCGTCSQEDCESEEHSFRYNALDDNVDRSYDESTHDCEEGWCADAHPEGTSCDSGMALLDVDKQMIWETTMTGTPSSLAATVDRFGEVVAYNASRNALQVHGCQGSIIMSIPLSKTQAGALDM